MVICSDLIYPAGGTLEYAYKHCWPYRDYPRPIYALPGNHDWYDSLRGFMAYFCGETCAPPRPRRSLLSRAGLLDRLWLEESEPEDPCKRQFLETLRRESSQQARLPGPPGGYCARVDTLFNLLGVHVLDVAWLGGRGWSPGGAAFDRGDGRGRGRVPGVRGDRRSSRSTVTAAARHPGVRRRSS
jgi:hypothetical protein